MDILLEYSLALKSVPPKYHDFVKALHRSKLLLHDQPLGPKNTGDIAYTDIRSRIKTSKWDSKRPSKSFIIWGDQGAVVVHIKGDEYIMYTMEPDLMDTFDKTVTSNATELKRNVKQNVGKVEGHSELPNVKTWASQPLSLMKLDFENINLRDVQRAKQVQQKRSGAETKEFSGVKLPQLAISVIDRAKAQNKLNDEFRNRILQGYGKESVNVPFLVFETVKPLLIRFINRRLGDIHQLLKIKMESATKNYHSQATFKQITELYGRARLLGNFARSLADEEYSSMVGGRLTDEEGAILQTIKNAIIMAAAQKYDEETTISGHPIRNIRTGYPGIDSLEASGEGYKRFMDDLLSGNKLALGSVMAWLGVLL